MSPVEFKHVDRFTDRHGKPRYYFRKGRGARVRLRGEPGSVEFLEAYRRAAELLCCPQLEGEAAGGGEEKSGH